MIKNAGYDIDFIDAPAEQKTLEEILGVIPKYDLVIMEGSPNYRASFAQYVYLVSTKFQKI